ncbi:hypothetical protein NE237_021279 [Protea cynaroides]|uniref:Uncharacterized protein n=1 Tax=Protea cynaroides TaxID=273540 RepID=A0A9Q0K2G2_9MAGN|nr:hypothetical protein NE237_021279 [Protea cynaroides]
MYGQVRGSEKDNDEALALPWKLPQRSISFATPSSRFDRELKGVSPSALLLEDACILFSQQNFTTEAQVSASSFVPTSNSIGKNQQSVHETTTARSAIPLHDSPHSTNPNLPHGISAQQITSSTNLYIKIDAYCVDVGKLSQGSFLSTSQPINFSPSQYITPTQPISNVNPLPAPNNIDDGITFQQQIALLDCILSNLDMGKAILHFKPQLSDITLS